MNKMRRQKVNIEDEDESKQQLNNLNRRMQQQLSEQISQVQKGSQKKLNVVNKARQIQQKFDHTQLLNNPNFRSAFSIRERTGNWVYNCFRCLNQEKSFLDVIEKQKKKNQSKDFSDVTKELQNQLKDRILKLKIIESSRMQLNPNVMHPFVKVHIVNIKNGSYFKTEQAPENCIYKNQYITYADDKGFQTCQNNLLLPFATNCCDFRQLGDSRGIWNQKFYINYDAKEIMTPDTLFLFEILDFNHQALLYKDTDIYDKDNYFRVAWGFLRPVGVGKGCYFGKTKIQLYKYKFRTKKMDSEFNKIHVPSVYYDFIWNDHEKYQGFLTIQLTHTQKPKRRIIQSDQYPKNIFQIQKIDDKELQNIFRTQKKNQQDDKIQIKHQILKFYRNKNRCEIPKEMIFKFESSRLGCFRVKFIGNYLYAACSQRKTTCIKVYNLQNGQKVMTLKGHRQIIYTLTTNSNDANNKQKYLITSGSDHFVRIWSLPDIFPEYIDEQQSNQYLMAQLLHTASVYSAVGILKSSNQFIYTVTCCYDGYVRLWESGLYQNKLNYSKIISQQLINTGQRSDQKVYPTCSAINKSNQIFIGDSYGDVHIYTMQGFRLQKSNRVTNPQLLNDSILSIQLIQRHLFIQASDNIIRRYQLSGSKLIQDKSYSGGQYQTLLLNSKISPDLKYLLAPSENGKPIMWDVLTGQIIDLEHLNLNIKGPLVCCDWHPKYNLIALSGFVENCPIFVYGNMLSQSEIKIFAV